MGEPAPMDEDWLPPLPDALPRVVTRADALARGYSATMIQRRLDSGRWRRVLPRTFLTVDTLTWSDRCHAAIAFGGRGALLSGAAALCDSGLRTVRRPQLLLVLVPITTRVQSARWVQVRPTRRMPERELAPGPSRARYARAVADLALTRRRLDDVRALVAEAVRRDLCTVDEVRAELETGPRNGSAHLRSAVDEVSGGAWSAPEARTARLLRAGGLGRFQQNVRIDLPDGRRAYADFLWPDCRAVLEVDSVEFHGLPPDADATDTRHIALEALGYSVIHRRPAYIAREPRAFMAGVATWLAGCRARAV